MVYMDFVKCPKYQTIQNCCAKRLSMNDENGDIELHNKFHSLPTRKNMELNAEQSRPLKNKRYDEYPDMCVSQRINITGSMYQSSELPYVMNDQVSNESTQEELSSVKAQEDNDFLCPRCGKRMQEPRLLPCLHPICSPCVSELRRGRTSLNDFRSQSTPSENNSNYYEICPLCDFQLPNANSVTPPPHYLLQHRLVMNAIQSRFANKILCDVCADEVVAVVQCSACLRNFCLDCGMEHQQQVTLELKPMKHSIRPLWEATKLRRTTLCQLHPTHALRYYCIACQQVTCKECMWSSQHRGHASENATGAGKRITVRLARMLQRAKILLNMLLTQYDRNGLLNTSFDTETGDISIPMDSRYRNIFTI